MPTLELSTKLWKVSCLEIEIGMLVHKDHNQRVALGIFALHCTPVMIRNCVISWSFFASSSPHALHTHTSVAYKVSSARLPDRNADCVVVAQEAGGITSLYSPYLPISTFWARGASSPVTYPCLGGALPQLSPVFIKISPTPLPAPSPASLHTDPRFRIEVNLESFLTIIYDLTILFSCTYS